MPKNRDSIHMATHAGALGVAAFAYWFARRHANNPRFTFGTGKVGDLAGFASALAFVIGRWSWSLLRDTAAVLVDAEAASQRYTEVREALEDRDAAIGDLHIWRIGPGKYAVIASLIAGDPLAPDHYASRLSEHAEYVHVTIEVHRCEHPHPELRAA